MGVVQRGSNIFQPGLQPDLNQLIRLPHDFLGSLL
jgi:hypothetical protein